jgi:SOS-response transcriptional repressor LexA
VVDWRARLRSAVERSGKSRAVVARDAGIAPETLSRILNNKHANPAFETVARIMYAVDEGVGWLLKESGFELSADERRQLEREIRFLQDVLAITQPPPIAPSVVPSPSAEVPRVYAVRGARFVYQACDNSMMSSGIIDGDHLFVKSTRELRGAVNRIVVCRVQGIFHVRFLEVRDRRIRLVSGNQPHVAIEIALEPTPAEFELIGVVIGRSTAF